MPPPKTTAKFKHAPTNTQTHTLLVRPTAAILTALLAWLPLSGCQKRCNDLDLGVAQLGMHESYTPGPIPLLDENIFHYKGPDYPQRSIPERLQASLLRQFPRGGNTQALTTSLASQHFTCTSNTGNTICHVGITVSRQERCSLFEDTRHDTYQESISISIREAKGHIQDISTTYQLTNITDTIKSEN